MKTYIITLIILSLASCRPQRSAMLSETLESQQQFQQRLLYHWGDSLSRQWSFYTDSSFVYHPDSALVAKSGYLWFNENRFQSALYQTELDSSLYIDKTLREKQSERGIHGWICYAFVWIGVITALAIGVGLRWRFKEKVKR